MESAAARQSVHGELERARKTFHVLVQRATSTDLRAASSGTRWTNKQLLFHMLLGYLVVRTLLPLVRFLGRRPVVVGRTFAAFLNAGKSPFHAVNYLGACGGSLILRGDRLLAQVDRTIDALHRSLRRESEATLSLQMPFPLGWDPYFTKSMSVLDVYHYATVHFDHHLRQLSMRLPHDEG